MATTNTPTRTSRLPAVNARNVLLNAANTILSRGRCRGDWEGKNGSVCADGALRIGAGAKNGNTVPTGSRQSRAYSTAYDALEADLSTSTKWTGVEDWSDSGHMSAKRIAARLTRVANNL